MHGSDEVDLSVSHRVQALPLLQRIKLRVLCWLSRFIFQALHATYRVEVHGAEHFRCAESMHSRGGMILPIWHEHHWSFIGAHPPGRINILISASTDGELISFVAKSCGFKTVRGSTNKGGMEASDALLQRCLDGDGCMITVDGPRGPRRKVKSGAVVMSRDGRLPLLPTSLIAERYWQLNSWDLMRIPKPFSRLLIVYGEPWIVDDDARGLRFGAAKQAMAKALDDVEQRGLELLKRSKAP